MKSPRGQKVGGTKNLRGRKVLIAAFFTLGTKNPRGRKILGGEKSGGQKHRICLKDPAVALTQQDPAAAQNPSCVNATVFPETQLR
jgi:hypothetical protein